jgi:uncharacterized repeat protein (TIGR03803 family)
VFDLNTDGTGFTVLHDFTASANGTYSNSDGFFPESSLTFSGNTLYGGAQDGGSWANGTVFKVNTDGTGFMTLYSFPASPNFYGGNLTGLVLSGKTLYGTAYYDGTLHDGIVFALSTDGSGFTVLHTFNGLDGAEPEQPILADDTLYGVANVSGPGGSGTIFSISLQVTPPQLTLTPAASNVILTWPTNATDFTLQSTTNLVSTVWTTNLPAPLAVNGQNTVTNPISSAQQFFRLAQ